MENSKKNVPEIRFPGFTDPWEQRKLGEILEDMYNGQTPSRANPNYWNGKIKWLSSGELNRGLITQCSESITEEGQKSANLRVVPKGTFIMAITGLEAAGTRGNCGILGFDTTMNQSCMALFPKRNKLCPEFLFQWYMMIGEEYGIRYTQGTKQQSYNAEIIKELAICLPKIEEQKRLAELLFCLDNLITLHQRKCDELRIYKQGLLQQMFPQPEESFPRVRFPGFTDPWEQRKLGDEFVRVNERNDGSFGKNHWISVAKMYFQEPEKVQSNNLDTRTYVMRLGDIAFEGHPNSEFQFGRFVANDIGDGIISELFPIYRHKLPYENSYWKYAIQIERVMRPIYAKAITSSGASSNKLNEEHFLRESILVPNLEEQKAIGTFFTSIDNLITLHQRKCDELKIYKKGLLQKMFV